MKHVNKHFIIMLLAALLFGAVLTACGGDDALEGLDGYGALCIRGGSRRTNYRFVD